METLTVCPYCGQPIGGEQVRRIHQAEELQRVQLQQEADDRIKEGIRTATGDLARRVQEANQQKAELEQRLRELGQQTDARIAAAVSQATDQFASALESAQDKVKRLQADLEGSVEEAEKRARQEVEARFYKDNYEKNMKLAAAQKTIQELQKKLEGKPAHELGTFQEDDLVRILQAEFPQDRIARIPQRAGADIEHEVLQDGTSCGVIVYESKNAALWSNEWIPKLKRDCLAHAASACILVTQAFPSKAQDFTSVDNVPVIHPRFLTSLVRVMRGGLVDVKVQALSQKDGGRKLEQFMSYLNGPDFRNRMQAVFSAVRKLEDIQHKERKAHDKTWKEQGMLHKSISVNGNDIDSEIKAILLGH